MDKKTFSVRRAAALVLALVMVLSTMTVMAFAADKVSVTIKWLHEMQLNDVKLYTYNGDVKGTENLLDGVEPVPDGSRKMYENIKLTPGESITITQYLYHDFIMPKEGGPVLLGEVSMCNDDENDNCFYEKMGRFPEIEEDEPPYRYLCTEYPAAKD